MVLLACRPYAIPYLPGPRCPSLPKLFPPVLKGVLRKRRLIRRRFLDSLARELTWNNSFNILILQVLDPRLHTLLPALPIAAASPLPIGMLTALSWPAAARIIQIGVSTGCGLRHLLLVVLRIYLVATLNAPHYLFLPLLFIFL